MKYPLINTIYDVLPVIEGRDEFYIGEKDGFQVVGYTHQGPHTFIPESCDFAMLRECRGLIFDMSGLIIRRPLHKFFNVGEKSFTQVSNIDWKNIKMIQRKLDGSMVAPFIVNDHLRWGTKAGISDVAMAAEVFVADKPELIKFAIHEIFCGRTPIFEFCSPKYQIVEKQDKETLTYICSRDMVSGDYNYTKTAIAANDIPSTLDCVIEAVKAFTDTEGVVIIGDDHYKVKSDWYIALHRAKDDINSEHKIIKLILDGKLDDLKPNLTADDLRKVEDTEKWYWDTFYKIASSVRDFYIKMDDYYKGVKKDFACQAAKNMNKYNRSLVFSLWGSAGIPIFVEATIIKLIKKHLGSETKYQEFKKEFLCIEPKK